MELDRANLRHSSIKPNPPARLTGWIHSALGYTTPAAFAAELNKQWPASLRPTGSAKQAIASTALMRKITARL
jgi:hypothetical protein